MNGPSSEFAERGRLKGEVRDEGTNRKLPLSREEITLSATRLQVRERSREGSPHGDNTDEI